MIPLSEIITRVRVRYESAAGGSSTRYSDTDIKEFVNEGLETLAESTLFYERYTSIPIEQNRQWYDLRGFTPEAVVRIKSIFSSVRNEYMEPTEESYLGYRWTEATGDPQAFFTRGVHWICVFPKPTATAGFLRIQYSGVPQMTHPQAVLGDLPDRYVPALEEYVLYEMSALDRATKSALSHWNDYATREKTLEDHIDRRIVSSRAGRFSGIPGYY